MNGNILKEINGNVGFFFFCYNNWKLFWLESTRLAKVNAMAWVRLSASCRNSAPEDWTVVRLSHSVLVFIIVDVQGWLLLCVNFSLYSVFLPFSLFLHFHLISKTCESWNKEASFFLALKFFLWRQRWTWHACDKATFLRRAQGWPFRYTIALRGQGGSFYRSSIGESQSLYFALLILLREA